MALPGAVLDANVLFPAVLRDTLVRSAEAEYFQPYWSTGTLDELLRNLVSDAGLSEERVSRLVVALRRHFPHAEVIGAERLIRGLTNHPKDRHVLAAAIAANARVIVTSNARHFPAEALRPHGVAARSPDQFLLDLLSDAGEQRMLEIIRRQAEEMRRPPMTAEQVLKRLARHAPSFVTALKSRVH